MYDQWLSTGHWLSTDRISENSSSRRRRHRSRSGYFPPKLKKLVQIFWKKNTAELLLRSWQQFHEDFPPLNKWLSNHRAIMIYYYLNHPRSDKLWSDLSKSSSGAPIVCPLAMASRATSRIALVSVKIWWLGSHCVINLMAASNSFTAWVVSRGLLDSHNVLPRLNFARTVSMCLLPDFLRRICSSSLKSSISLRAWATTLS